MRVPSIAFAVASLTWFAVACSFTSSGAGGPGAEPVAATTPTNGHSSDPSEVDCNGASTSGTQFCSVTSQQGCCASGSGPGSCNSDSQPSSCNGANQWFFQCDEAADCAQGQVCFLTGSTFACATSCSGGLAAQSCRLNSECGQDGGSCVVQTCNGGIFAELCAVGNGCTAAP